MVNYLYGIHGVQATLNNRPKQIRQLYYLASRTDKALHGLLTQAKQQGIDCRAAHKEELNTLSHHGVHQGVVIECSLPPLYSEADFFSKIVAVKGDNLFILILDGIQDPHNLGACLRTAEAAGVHSVLITQHDAVGLTPAVCKVAAGAAETIPLVKITNLQRLLKRLKASGVWLYGLTGAGTHSIYGSNLTGPLALVLGAEGTGLRRLTASTCDYLIYIPMQGTVTSVNVSVAAGISCFEVLRQRLTI